MCIIKVLAKSLFTLHTCTRSLIICTSVNMRTSHVNVLLAGICNQFMILFQPLLGGKNLSGIWNLLTYRVFGT